MATAPHPDRDLAARTLLADIGDFSHTTNRLRPYQLDAARAIVRSVRAGDGKTFSVMFARQMGKNELSAILETYLLCLFAAAGGSIVKAAPSFKPQIVNSILRLQRTLQTSALTRDRWKPRYGYMLQLGRSEIAFLSADPKASVVGATASLLLEIDEAQDVDEEQYTRAFRPMASSTNATTVLYGTAWSSSSLLEQAKNAGLAHERETGERLHFGYDYTALAAINPAYKAFVEGEIARQGIDHPAIRTQYLLHCLADAGQLFSLAQRRALAAGKHQRERFSDPKNPAGYQPPTHTQRGGRHWKLSNEETGLLVAGIDVAGSDEEAEDAHQRGLIPRRDSTVLTLARVSHRADGAAVAQVIDHLWWVGKDEADQADQLLQILQHRPIRRIVVDSSGIGAFLASFLSKHLGESKHGGRVEEFVFTAPSKSQLAYTALAMLNTDRLTMYKDDGSRDYRELWQQIEQCQYELKANEILRWSVPPSKGHDDFVASLLLCARAADQTAQPPVSSLIRSRPTDTEPGDW